MSGSLGMSPKIQTFQKFNFQTPTNAQNAIESPIKSLTRLKWPNFFQIETLSITQYCQMVRSTRLRWTNPRVKFKSKKGTIFQFFGGFAKTVFSSYSGVVWFLTIAVTVTGLWIYKHYRVKVDGVNFSLYVTVVHKI